MRRGKRAEDRDCDRRRKGSKIVATVTEMNKSVEFENRVTWNCLTHPHFFIC